MTYLISEKKRRKRKPKTPKNFGVVNYFDAVIDTPITGSPFASVDGSQPSSESLVGDEYSITGDIIEVYGMKLTGTISESAKALCERTNTKMAVFNPGSDFLHLFESYDRYYGNLVILYKS